MVKAMRDCSLPDLGCFAHTLQLVVHDGVLSQRAVSDTLAVCRRIVGHFKRSTLACTKLHKIQQNLGLPRHRLKQDEPTRWNSSLYMLQSVIEQKMALAAYATENDVSQLTPNQLELACKTVAALSPVEEITLSISTDKASVAIIVPFIRALRKTLEKHDGDSGVRTMKAEMLCSLNRRYRHVESNKVLALATLLDPRFKDKFFSSVQIRTSAKQMLEEEVAEFQDPASQELPDPSESSPKTQILGCFSEILEESGASIAETSGTEVDKYLAEPLIPFHRDNSYDWWAENKIRFPVLAKVAQRFLSAPPTSVPSERLFSGAGDVYDEKRNRLAPERAEMLLFIKYNLALVGGQYKY